jgi:hypothetical protein
MREGEEMKGHHHLCANCKGMSEGQSSAAAGGIEKLLRNGMKAELCWQYTDVRVRDLGLCL